MKNSGRTSHFYRRQINSLARFFRIKKEVNYFIATALATLLFAALMNALYQADRYAAQVADKAEFAVFVSSSADPDGVARQLTALPGVAQVRFVGSDEAMAAALRAAPDLKDFLIAGDNPFSSYFLVRPRDIKPSFLREISAAVAAIPGIADTASDPAVFGLYDILHTAIVFTRMIAGFVLAGFILTAGIVFVYKWFFRKIDYRRYIYLAGWGIVCGSSGIAMYVAASRYVLPHPGVQLPVDQLVLLLPIAIIMNIAWEK